MNFFQQPPSLCTLVLLFFTTLLSTCTSEVVTLNDATFEHQTQASTGMTTGSWLIFFKAQRCPHCNNLMPQYEDLSNDEDLLEKGIVLATLDVQECTHVMNRFMVRGFPTLMYLHKKKLYEYKGKRNYEALKEFVLEGFENVEAKEIPPPPSALESYIKLGKAICLELKDAAMGRHGATGYAILGLVGSLLVLLGSIIAMFFLPAKKTKIS